MARTTVASQMVETLAAAGVNRLKTSHRQQSRPPFERIALLLQGGGALGAYQPGFDLETMRADALAYRRARQAGWSDGPAREAAIEAF